MPSIAIVHKCPNILHIHNYSSRVSQRGDQIRYYYYYRGHMQRVYLCRALYIYTQKVQVILFVLKLASVEQYWHFIHNSYNILVAIIIAASITKSLWYVQIVLKDHRCNILNLLVATPFSLGYSS